MRKLAAALLLITVCLSASAQQKTMDSLKKLIATAKDDTSRVSAMRLLAPLYMYSKPDSALALANDMVRISKTAQYRKGEEGGLNQLGNVYLVTGNYPKALTYSLSALKINEQIGFRLGMVRVLGNIGNAYAS